MVVRFYANADRWKHVYDAGFGAVYLEGWSSLENTFWLARFIERLVGRQREALVADK